MKMTKRLFAARLKCRVAGHKMGPWRQERATALYVAEARVCIRYCHLPGSYEIRTLPTELNRGLAR